MGILLSPRPKKEASWLDPERGVYYEMILLEDSASPSTPHAFEWHPECNDKEALAEQRSLDST